MLARLGQPLNTRHRTGPPRRPSMRAPAEVHNHDTQTTSAANLTESDRASVRCCGDSAVGTDRKTSVFC